ncbi:hypothetical protein D7Y16_02625 [Stenotrophomonas maltophilia]|nr:hypothetical protein [Stenotrophomonas maltophilia]MBA0246779.1 hypothetical protein [Stenotrophomonas maltophilia]MBA0305728.1 hypothetical protein [Stenotrophomonas maltophilia]MBA0437357.1 hypothetical protein [Stenotrophomonas maltophilia]MBA0514240.1 hypothetical protein [Stenotrophomonas maltophilia]
MQAWPRGSAPSSRAGSAGGCALRRCFWRCTVEGDPLLAAEAAQQGTQLVGQCVVLPRDGNVVA